MTGVSYPGMGLIPPHGYTERRDHYQVVTSKFEAAGGFVWTTAIYPPGTGWVEQANDLESVWVFKEGDRPAPLFVISSDSDFQAGRAHEMAIEYELDVPHAARRSVWSRIGSDEPVP